MVKFRKLLQDRLLAITTTAVGVGSDPQSFVKTFDNRLRDVDIDKLPFLVVNVRTAEKLLAGEIGNTYQKYTWTVHIYYLDMEVNENNYDIADERRDTIIGKVEKVLEENKFLADPVSNVALKAVDTDGHQESVYDSSIQMINFDESGQDGHYSFVSELYFEVYTDRM